MPALLLVLVM